MVIDQAAVTVSAATGYTRGESVRCHALTKSYAGVDTAALGDVDLDVDAGTVTVLLGPSGCGKTTLLRCLAGLESPQSGRIHIGGVDVINTPAEDRGVAMVFQNYGLYPNKTVFGNIEFPLRMTRVKKDERRRRVHAIAELLRLGELLHRKPKELSGGQRQRVGIGRALVREPAVLLMDEPFSNLDAELRADMRTELIALQRKFGTTIVFVTHDQTEALSLADRLVVMRAGRIEQAGAPDEVFEQPATSFVASFVSRMNIFDGGPLASLGPPGTAAVGLRPDHLRLGDGPSPRLRWHAEVVMTELHGRDRLVHLDVDGHRARMQVPSHVRPAGVVGVHALAADLHFFTHDGARFSQPDRLEAQVITT
ncbi:ABC transporter ATP-binding protein [Mycobacterium sp. pW049]|uniref:ABC transporter ATP-binding protein n=1 Tax=[Mycobacterium] bulgaricum TaxID=3238985 RepID=UPI00351AF47D